MNPISDFGMWMVLGMSIASIVAFTTAPFLPLLALGGIYVFFKTAAGDPSTWTLTQR